MLSLEFSLMFLIPRLQYFENTFILHTTGDNWGKKHTYAASAYPRIREKKM